jgi:hypothetical protein
MGQLYTNEIQMIYIYTKCFKHSLSTKVRVKHNMRGQQPLFFSFTKITIFNSYFAHKRNPKNMMSPPYWATFGTFGQVVELEKEKLGLQRPMVFIPCLSSMVQGFFPPKRAKYP